MTPEQFKLLVSSRRSADRRIAAREIVANATLVGREVIVGAFHRETVPQIRQQFATALESLDARAPSVEPPAKEARAIYNEAHVKAVRMVTEQLLHQLNPLIGDIEGAASTEVPNYDASRTKVSVGQIKLQAEAIAKLYHASKPAVYEEFDLAEVIRNCLPSDLKHDRCTLDFTGKAPLLVQGDQSLVTIAVTNGLRNAIEASISIASEEHKPLIVVNWGATDRDYWISIIDEGEGFHGNIAGAFNIGTSNKPGHGGHGLPAIRAAMLSLSGTADLVPKERGCALNLSWTIIGVTQ